MVLSAIATLVSETISLDPEIIGSIRMARAVETRRVDCKLPDIKSYWIRLQTSAEELEELIELLIVPETWFFRDGKPFDYLTTYVTSERLRSPSLKPLQLLSIPCSTGEEPYSMAIALLEAGLYSKQFAIDALDISHRSIAKAKRGVYTKNSFRGDPWTNIQRYFQETPGGYELSQSVRTLVNFQQGNVLTFLEGQSKRYDIIFCRNLLIYLKSEACEQILEAIDRLLIPGGLLFLGSSETGKMVAPNYEYIRQPFTFAYRKQDLAQTLPDLPISRGLVSKPSPRAQTLPNLPTSRGLVSKPSPVETYLADLPTARKLADEGNLASATTLCQNYLKKHPTSGEAYLLLGELYQADQKKDQAEQCFQRAIYLDPHSEVGLVHLALLKESQGDTVKAKQIQERIKRLQQSLWNQN